MKVVPSELKNQGRVELVTLFQFCITTELDMEKFQDLLEKILAVLEEDDKTVRISMIKLILKAVHHSLYSSKFVISVDLLKMMREISPTVAIVNFTGLMMSYVREILQNCKDTGYVAEMVEMLSFADLEGLFIGDVVDGVVAMTTKQLHPIDNKVYVDVFKELRKNNGKLTLTAKSAENLLESTQHVIETDNLDKFVQLLFQLVEICAGSEQNFVDVDVKNKFVSDFGTLFENRIITAVEVADKKIVPLQIFCTTFTSHIQLGFNIDGETFTKINDFQVRESSNMGNDEKISFRDMMSATVEKWGGSLSTNIGLDLWKNLLNDEQFDDNGTLANAVLINIPISDETWDFILTEIVWKETPSREDNIYRALITLVSNSKFPRSRVVDVVKRRYNKLILQFFIAWISDKKNENISPEVDEVFEYGSKYLESINQSKEKDSDNLLKRVEKIVESGFLQDSSAEIQLFFDLYVSLITRAKGGTLSSVYWVKCMVWQIVFVFSVNIELGSEATDKVNVESVRLGTKLLLDSPMQKDTLGETELTNFKWQLERLKEAGWTTEEIKGDIGKVQENMGGLWG
ncbi:uncharacterized protein LOC118437979 [Folsomia candida]|nr:uncharacterized protein LOC118437979 [Folsomia candida]XP_035713482.1 uncharacterized protein LOC118437979 [Folsomia candida]